ncbi:SipW-dependent-type signal peptide-containing protein [Leucobacter sp. HY1910]
MSKQENVTVKRGWTKARAVLAGGLVLGVGAAITLAAWTDQEWAKGIFSSGTFGIEGSIDGVIFTDHATVGDAATLNFQVNADKLAPGDDVYAGFAVQLIDGATNEAEVTVAQNVAAAISGTTASYVYTTAATCDASAYTAGTNENGTTFDLAAVETPTFLCFKVTADNTIEQGETGTIVWSFTAESTDAI